MVHLAESGILLGVNRWRARVPRLEEGLGDSFRVEGMWMS